jgi:hypothetical protein
MALPLAEVADVAHPPKRRRPCDTGVRYSVVDPNRE